MNTTLRGLLAAVALGLSLGAHAADAPPENPAWAEAKTVAKAGPADIAIAGQATLHLPAWSFPRATANGSRRCATSRRAT
jgi:uncharacterized membrane-anchored protein